MSSFRLVIFMLTSFGILLAFGCSHRANAEAVPLVPIDTGDQKMDKKVSAFYDCIKKAVKTNKDSDLPSYFHTEPTKYQAIVCYHNTFDKDNSDNINNEKYHTTDHKLNDGEKGEGGDKQK